MSRAQMIEVDRIMVEELHIELAMMMENAGRSLARLALDLANPSSVVVYAGSGGNGGGGLVAGRHLANAGVEVHIILSRRPGELSGVPRHQLDVLSRMGVSINESVTVADLTIDALIGYSLDGPPQGRTAELIASIPRHHNPVLALDTPSGVDVTTGEASGNVVSADATLTLASPKRGLHASPHVGELFLADISVPPLVFDRLEVPAPNFRAGPILHVVDETA